MNASSSHLIALPVILPLVTAATLLWFGDRQRRIKTIINLTSTLGGVVVAVALLLRVDQGDGSGDIGVYLAGNWTAPFGIVLVADRLCALMLVLVSVVSSCVALYAEAAWARASVYFHALFQVQLMGLNGAFLTGDLFNLFVFFEVLLAASYGLQLHGSGWPRVRSGLHYIAVNLLASSLFLIGLAVLYGVLGTLNMADIADKIAHVPAGDRGLLHAGATILAVAFLIKAAAWPLNAWLVPAYTATSAPVAALFALMTKVGIYVLLRTSTLFFSDESWASAHFGQSVTLWGGLATLAFGTIGLVASMRAGSIASYSIIVSSGTLLAALGLSSTSVTAAALYYVVSATLAASALFLLVELIERARAPGQSGLELDPVLDDDTNLDDEEFPLVGRAFSASLAWLGLAFVACALLVAGLPPLSGFIAKFAILAAVVREAGSIAQPAGAGSAAAPWVMVGLLLLSGLAATVSLARLGIRRFWSGGDRYAPRVRGVEALAMGGLLVSCMALTVGAEPVMRYTHAAAAGLHSPRAYIDAVLSARVVPGPARQAGGAP